MTTFLTLVDVAKLMAPDGTILPVAEMLSQENEILQDMPFMEGNLPTGHRVAVRTGLPTVTWRRLNQGVLPDHSRVAQVDESVGMLESYSQTDKDVVELATDPQAVRLQEARAHIEAMSQEFADTLFYGDTTAAPAEFNGFSSRYNLTTNENGRNIVLGGGAGADNTSIWLVTWNPDTVYGIYPRSSKAGLFHEDLGLETVSNAGGVTNALMRAYRDHFQWKGGLCVKDWRYAVRIPNIDISNLVARGASAADLFTLMAMAIHRIHNISAGHSAFYMNRTVRQELDIQARSDVKDGGGLTYQNVDGMIRASFRGIPVRLCDAIRETETLVA